ncbi:MAG: carbon-nitrogen hydrolase family protein [Clostridia bacterium]|nr:carbon-nitrogen hydrolase family protein [Clostridia bacterium]
MNILNVALLQISPTGSIDGNLIKGIEFCRKAKDMGADIALFPEMYSNGYDIYNTDASEWTGTAISADSKFVCEFSHLAKELNMAIGITLLEKTDAAPRNTLVLFNRRGSRILTYAKVHTCDFGPEKDLTPGDDFYVSELDTEKGVITVGAMICYDREFPESARILMLKGAEIILVPNACPMEINRLCQLRGRAYENMVGIATCNYPETVPDCNGHSSAFDGVAYLPELSGSRDTCIAEAGGEECICMAQFDLDMMRRYRANEVHGNAYRSPEKYKLLISEEIREPFIRKDYRKR